MDKEEETNNLQKQGGSKQPDKWTGMTLEQKKQEIKMKVDKNKVNDIELLAASTPELFDYMIEVMSTNKHSKRASELVSKHKKDFKDYPLLMERLEKKAVRFMMNDQPWSLVENRLKNSKGLLSIAAEDYHFNNQHQISYSIIVRNGLKDHIKKTEVKEWLESPEAALIELLENTDDKNDVFGRGY